MWVQVIARLDLLANPARSAISAKGWIGPGFYAWLARCGKYVRLKPHTNDPKSA
jgi:hypothetical protein